jgi:hypothetical protein
MVNAEEHAALSARHDNVSGLMLMLPGHLDASCTVDGLVASIEQARAGLADRVRRSGVWRRTMRPEATGRGRRHARARPPASGTRRRPWMRRSSRPLICGSSTTFGSQAREAPTTRPPPALDPRIGMTT